MEKETAGGEAVRSAGAKGDAVIFGSLFSGCGGFDLGLEQAGMTPAWQVEIDPSCNKVLHHRWPNLERHEDVRNVGAGLSRVDLLCGGFPCQDLSVAGRRAGLDGERSGLFYELARVVETLAPSWLLVENVPGLLSADERRAMGTVLWRLEELGYLLAYRVLDSRYFGVAQRRRRVFIVGHLGSGRAAEVLFEQDSVPGNPPPSREKGSRVAASLTRGAESGGRGGYAGRRREDAENIVAGTPLAVVGLNWQSGGSAGRLGLGPQSDALQVGQTAGVATFNRANITSKTNRERVELGSPSGTLNEEPPHLIGAGVRRLTPRECERLQGFPDDWTRYGANHKGQVSQLKDAPRYRMLGNAVTVNVARWIAQRIVSAA